MSRTKTETEEQLIVPETEVIQIINDLKTTIYMGPNIPGGVLFHGAVFKGALPNYVTVLFDTYSRLERLFIDISALPQFKDKVSKKGSFEYQLYQDALKKED